MGGNEARERIAAVFNHYLAVREMNQTEVRRKLAVEFPHVANSAAHISQIANGRTGAKSTLIDALDVVLETGEKMGQILREANQLPVPELNIKPQSGFRCVVVTLTTSRTSNSNNINATSHQETQKFAHMQPVATEMIDNGVVYGFDFGVAVAARTHTAVFSDVTDLAIWVNSQTHTLTPGLPEPYHCVYIKEHKYNTDEIETITAIASGLPQLATTTKPLDGFEQQLIASGDLPVGAVSFNCPQLSYGYATRDGLAHYRKCSKHALTDDIVTVTAAQVQAVRMLTATTIEPLDSSQRRVDAIKNLDRAELALLKRLTGRHSHRQQKLVDTVTKASEIELRISNAKRRIKLEQDHTHQDNELPKKPS